MTVLSFTVEAPVREHRSLTFDLPDRVEDGRVVEFGLVAFSKSRR